MKKTLEQVLIEQAEQIEKSAEAIRQIVAKSKDAGIVWPEIDENEQIFNFRGCPPLKKVITPYCTGCFFYGESGNIPCPTGEYSCGEVLKDDHIIYVKA